MSKVLSKVVEINGKTYIIEPFYGIKGLKLKVEVSKLIAPVFNGELAISQEEGDMSTVLNAIKTLIESNPTDKLISVIQELITGVRTEKGKIDFDIEFQKNYMTLYKLIYEVIKENYDDVFSQLGTLVN